jgi:hypothetical protein
MRRRRQRGPAHRGRGIERLRVIGRLAVEFVAPNTRRRSGDPPPFFARVGAKIQPTARAYGPDPEDSQHFRTRDVGQGRTVSLLAS